MTIGNGDANAAILVLNASNQIRDTSAVTINTDGQLDLQTSNDTIGALTMSGGSVTGTTGTLTLSADLTFNGTRSNTATIASNLNLGGNRLAQINNGVGGDSDLTISGAVSGAYTLTKAGAGTLTLSGTNSYSATSITAGTLQIGSGDTTGLARHGCGRERRAASIFNRTQLDTVANAISGTGTARAIRLRHDDPHRHEHLLRHVSTINAGMLQIGSGGTTGSLGARATSTNNGTLDSNRSNSDTAANAISGSGHLTQAGAGTTTLTGTNTYSGTTTSAPAALKSGAAARRVRSVAGSVPTTAPWRSIAATPTPSPTRSAVPARSRSPVAAQPP